MNLVLPKPKNTRLFKSIKNTNKLGLCQILDLIPDWIPQININKYNSDMGYHRYKTQDQINVLILGKPFKCTTLVNMSAYLIRSQTAFRISN